MSETQGALRELAEAAGISTHWTHADGYDVKVEDGPLRRILAAMDLPCETETQCRQSLAELDEEKRQQAWPPLLTAWCGDAITLDAACGLHGREFELTVNGRTERGNFSSDRNLPLTLPRIATPGYHTLEIAGRRTTLALAPSRCFNIHDISVGLQRQSKYWSLAVQLYALRRRGDAGVGDFTALRMLAEAAGRRGAAALTISPVHAMPDQGLQHFSPYSPSSRLFLNALHIDPATILDSARFDAAVSEDICSTRLRSELEDATMIDWPLASNWRISLLRRMFERFKAEGGDRESFAAFRREQGEALEDHARFEALHSYFAMQGLETFWPKWPEAYRHPRRREVEAFAHEHADDVAFHAFLQWQAARGMEAAQQAARAAGMPIGLISDLAVGSDRGGSQAWSRQEEMLNQLSIGAPPDHFNPRGQNWGLVTLCPRAMRRTGFHAYLEMLRANLRHAGGVRIDHILGLARLWLIPPDSPPECGAYLRYPMDDMLRLLALESHLHRAIVIGENLGTIPEGFNEKLVGAGVLGMQVLWFLRRGNDFLSPPEWGSDGIGMTTTHDLPTVTGWWNGCDIAWKAKLDLFDKGASRESETHQRAIERRTLRHALDAFQADQEGAAIDAEERPVDEEAPLTEILAFVGASPAPLVVVPLEDVLANAEQPNLPGTVDEHPNWRQRMSVPVDKLFEVPAVERRIAALADARSKVRP